MRGIGHDAYCDTIGHDYWCERKPRAKKNRLRWCRGKVGVPHQPVVVLDKYFDYMRDRDGVPPACNWTQWRHGVTRRWMKPHYRCYHLNRCSECGKQLGYIPRSECPDFERASQLFTPKDRS